MLRYLRPLRRDLPFQFSDCLDLLRFGLNAMVTCFSLCMCRSSCVVLLMFEFRLLCFFAVVFRFCCLVCILFCIVVFLFLLPLSSLFFSVFLCFLFFVVFFTLLCFSTCCSERMLVSIHIRFCSISCCAPTEAL